MQITLTGRHFEITDPLRQHIDNKMSKLDRYVNGITDVHVVLSVEKHRHIAEINLQVHGNLIRGLEEKHDMYQAVDAAIDKLERQVKRFKDKETDHKGRLGTKGSNLIAAQHQQQDAPPTAAPKVIRSKKFAVKPMSVDEAAMQMALVQDDFLAFLNSDTDQMNVMYKRSDGNYGLIEPEF
ncbi:ribosome-associated translation inhibitor RaiA [candidate division KSB3 bacterium]|uniref:Ribosome hibernation promoting factor n=1 Tax=candidate division KSB3 bacterium TaxID=2044937 RepID=A0A9D5JZ40_9BACT|nr:ribosome-associated translation inhibitor RaiA [candidate division KSB3 bacterium]MBD3326675.1 ribosome-associated translation inhibitor RaiA [candidate division KSB3 bacterium]